MGKNEKKVTIHCWICEKGANILHKEDGKKHTVSKELHDFIMASIKLKSGYFLAFNALADYLIGDEENSKIYNSCGSPDYNGEPMKWALEVLKRCGADRKF